MSKMEQRVNVAGFEIREESDGMHFTGYAALFDRATTFHRENR